MDYSISEWCRNEPGNVLRVGHFNDDNNADLLCDDTNNGNNNKVKMATTWRNSVGVFF